MVKGLFLNDDKKMLRNLFEQYIQGTQKEAIVPDKTIFFCYLTNKVSGVLKMPGATVYVKTISLKHMYDKRPAEEFDFIIDNLHEVVMYPDCIYKNKSPKRGSFCFTKKIQGEKYLCSLEITEKSKREITIVTAFRVRKDSYLNSYELWWSWRGDNPSS